MRTAMVAAGLVAAASAYTSVVDVTVTACPPEVTNCPYQTGTAGWEDWSTTTTTKKIDPINTATNSWEEWSTTTTKKIDPINTGTTTWGDWATTTKKIDPINTATNSWEDWASTTKKVDPINTATTWADWSSQTVAPISTVTSSCPVYTATGAPDWLSLLPTDVKSSLAAKWTGAAPSDWCYYSFSTTVSPAQATTAAGWSSQAVAPVST